MKYKGKHCQLDINKEILRYIKNRENNCCYDDFKMKYKGKHSQLDINKEILRYIKNRENNYCTMKAFAKFNKQFKYNRYLREKCYLK